MRLAAWYGVLVAILVVGQWVFFVVSGDVPELEDAPKEIVFHITAEIAMALVLLAGSIAVLRSRVWGAYLYLVGAGMVVYSVINSPGYFAQAGDWGLMAIFMVLLVLTVCAVVLVVRAGVRSC